MMRLGLEQKYLQPAIRGKIADLLDYPVASARVVLSGAKLAEKLCTVTGLGGLFMFSRVSCSGELSCVTIPSLGWI
jgi:hypothetical protein